MPRSSGFWLKTDLLQALLGLVRILSGSVGNFVGWQFYMDSFQKQSCFHQRLCVRLTWCNLVDSWSGLRGNVAITLVLGENWSL